MYIWKTKWILVALKSTHIHRMRMTLLDYAIHHIFKRSFFCQTLSIDNYIQYGFLDRKTASEN